MNYLNKLNSEQREAVLQIQGSCLVIASAGTGKTTCIVNKVRYLIDTGLHPSNILMLTFTKKASAEMMNRIKNLSDMATQENPVGGTFHSFALDSLRCHSGNRQQVIDEGEVRSFFRVKVKDTKLDRAGIDPYELMQLFSKVVNKGKPLSELMPETWKDFERKLVVIQKEYVVFKQRQNLLDFDDILLEFNLMLERQPQTRQMLGQKLKYILVDEYQDTNILQARMLDLLTMEHDSVTAVGDYAQSIYGFRGANPDNINTFLEKFPHARIIKLNQNYRSHQNIIRTVNSFYKRLNLGKLENPLRTEIKSTVMPQMVVKDNQYQQNDFIIDTIKRLDHSETAILYRGNYDARGLEYALVNKGVSYQKYGGQEVKEAKHIKDFMAYLRIILNPKDAGAWKRLLLFQKGIGKETATKILGQVEQKGFAGLQAVKGKGAQTLHNLYWLLSQPYDVTTTIDHVHQHYREILDSKKDLKTEYEAYPTRVKDIEQLSIQWRISGSLQEIVDAWYTADIFDPEATKSEKLTLSTIHSAKGLEWDNVFIINVTEGRLPSAKSMHNDEDLQEEYRLFYVAMTRARQRLYLCYPRMYIDGRNYTSATPSRFLNGLELKPKS